MNEKVMNIDFIINDKSKGYMIIGGMNEAFSLEKLKMKGMCIKIKNSSEEILFHVKKVDISTSIIGRVNIGLALFESSDFDKIKTNDEVFICDCQ